MHAHANLFIFLLGEKKVKEFFFWESSSYLFMYTDQTETVLQASNLAGLCINNCKKIYTKASYTIKWN